MEGIILWILSCAGADHPIGPGSDTGFVAPIIGSALQPARLALVPLVDGYAGLPRDSDQTHFNARDDRTLFVTRAGEWAWLPGGLELRLRPGVEGFSDSRGLPLWEDFEGFVWSFPPTDIVTTYGQSDAYEAYGVLYARFDDALCSADHYLYDPEGRSCKGDVVATGISNSTTPTLEVIDGVWELRNGALDSIPADCRLEGTNRSCRASGCALEVVTCDYTSEEIHLIPSYAPCAELTHPA